MMQYHDIMEPDTAYVSVRSSQQCKEIQGSYCLMYFRQRSAKVRLKLELRLRCMCEQTSEKAASRGTIQGPWHICLDVGAGRSQMGLRT